MPAGIRWRMRRIKFRIYKNACDFDGKHCKTVTIILGPSLRPRPSFILRRHRPNLSEHSRRDIRYWQRAVQPSSQNQYIEGDNRHEIAVNLKARKQANVKSQRKVSVVPFVSILMLFIFLERWFFFFFLNSRASVSFPPVKTCSFVAGMLLYRRN